MSSEMSSSRGSAASVSSNRSGRQHSTMPTYTPQHPRAVHPLAVRHSASLDLQRKDKVVQVEQLTPRKFLDKYSLPRVVRVMTEPQGDTLFSGGLGPLARPLLLYRQYRSTKVQARSVPGPKDVTPVGPSLVIPDCYQGWFSLVTAKGQLTAQCYTCIEQLVANHVSSFLTKLDLTAYKLNDGKDALHKDSGSTRGRRLQYVKSSISAGHVIRLLAVFEDVHHPHQRATRRLSFVSIGRGMASNKKYAQCVNHKNQMVFIPVNTTGQFYAVSCGPDEQDDLRMLYQVPQLLADYRLPLKVHLVQGTLPSPRPSGFSGTLMLEFYQEEDVILACTLPQDPTSRTSSPSHSSVQPRLLEMDADSKFLLSRPLFHQESESRLFKSPVLQVALCFCRDRGDHWRRQIKVTHHIFPSLQSNPSAKLTNPQKETKVEAAPVVTKMVSKERNETRNKISRPITKKSSSFTYTKVQSDVPVISGSGPPCELLRVTKTTAPTSPLERALSHEQIIKSPAICQQEKLQKHSIVISALTRESRQTRLPSVADIQNRDLPSILKPLGEEIPYGRVADDVGNVLARCNDDENIYAEICDCETNNTSRNNNKHKFRYLCLRSKNMDTRKEDFYYVQLEGGRERVHSNISPPTPSTQEPTYDTVC